MDPYQIRKLAHQVSIAHAGLTALCAYYHDGRELPNAVATLARSLEALREAQKLAEDVQALFGVLPGDEGIPVACLESMKELAAGQTVPMDI